MVKIPMMKKVVKIPENVEVTVDNKSMHIKGEKGVLSKTLPYPKIEIKIQKNIIEVSCKLPRRQDKALIGTTVAHIKNMIKGITKGFEYTLKTVYSHFPIKTVVKENQFIIQNFLGEHAPRKAPILEGAEVEVKGDIISVRGIDKEKVGQTAANIERAAMVKHRDIRVFQDGVYIISKK
ncbi:LSU ribosomal protein L6P [Thermoplasmatales archaeon SCGC AB-539-N05]|nr:LSU ribosomal protein L6P [Thermoplasmatales archaeon SCGC AB-539-N05]EMR74305.1 LSU ribosomal protein L6P [Thermoplasmatales archaeon SCGC AB-539-N05]ENO12301.1 LSU ribosomal protein L6P [Thermoplasmatales archaeon SCGC AB-539-C06]